MMLMFAYDRLSSPCYLFQFETAFRGTRHFSLANSDINMLTLLSHGCSEVPLPEPTPEPPARLELVGPEPRAEDLGACLMKSTMKFT